MFYRSMTLHERRFGLRVVYVPTVSWWELVTVALLTEQVVPRLSYRVDVYADIMVVKLPTYIYCTY